MNHLKLYDNTCHECSQLITKRYSTSFSLGITMFDKKLRRQIYSIYGFVRFADEIVDTFHQHDKKELLKRFREETFRAIEEKISLNPVLHAFQEVVNVYQIDHKLIHAFLDSMEMDLHFSNYEDSMYKRYIYGSAEVVGLMCLRVFCSHKPGLYEELEPAACALGSAFQKVNFLRDMKSDFQERGRVYFPEVDYLKFDEQTKKNKLKPIYNQISTWLIREYYNFLITVDSGFIWLIATTSNYLKKYVNHQLPESQKRE